MKFIGSVLCTILFVLVCFKNPLLFAGNDVLFQTSTINALLKSVFDGEMTFGELKQHGGFGLGTFNSLDGEMIALDNKFYQIKADGNVYGVDDSQITPFAVVTFFDVDKSISPTSLLSYEQLQIYIDESLPTNNIYYAIKITGTFKYIKARSVPKQSKPYPAIMKIIKTQPIFEFNDVKGTMVGFRLPGYINGINVPGYHFHFITDDKKAGGHVLGCQLKDVKIEIDYTNDLNISLPNVKDFYGADLSKKGTVDINKVEK